MRISDWSSYVCSSDLQEAAERRDRVRGRLARGVDRPAFRDAAAFVARLADLAARRDAHRHVEQEVRRLGAGRGDRQWIVAEPRLATAPGRDGGREIGRASCRESGCQYV